MSLDTWILVFAAACQAATGYWAFHVSTEGWKARWGFGAVTLVGIGLVVWTGIRGNEQADKNQNAIIQDIGVVHKDFTGYTNSREWRRLSDREAFSLSSRLKSIAPQPIGVACATENCAQLADQIAEIFHQSSWTPNPHHGGGLGVDGVTGILVDSCNGTSKAVADAIQQTTPLIVEAREGQGCTEPDYLVIGEKPF